MHDCKLKNGSQKVKNSQQLIAIVLSKARQEGAKVPKHK